MTERDSAKSGEMVKERSVATRDCFENLRTVVIQWSCRDGEKERGKEGTNEQRGKTVVRSTQFVQFGIDARFHRHSFCEGGFLPVDLLGRCYVVSPASEREKEES